MVKAVKKNLVTLERMEVIKVPIDSIHPNDYNPNRQSDREFELLLRSIEEDGFTQPILVRKGTDVIVDGEHRWRACKILGWTDIPVVYCEMTQEQMMIATLRHNRARGSEDISKSADVLRSIQDLGALDHAADSLLLDEVELKIMLEDIPQAELVLRDPTKNLTVQEVNDIIQQENRFNSEKDKEDSVQASKEKRGNQTYVLRYYQYEQKQIMATMEELPGQNIAEKTIALINLYKDDPDAVLVIASQDEKPWQGTTILPKGAQ